MYLCYKKRLLYKVLLVSLSLTLPQKIRPARHRRLAPRIFSFPRPNTPHRATTRNAFAPKSQTNRSRGGRSPSPSVLAPAGRKRMADGDGSPPLVPRSPGGGTGAGHTTPPTPDASSACLLLRLRPSLSSSTRAARPRNRIQSPAVHSGAVPNRGRAEGALWFLERRSNPPSDATSDSARLRVTAREQEQPQMTPF